MIKKLPPSPLGFPPGSSYWNDWYEKLRQMVNGGLSILWTNIDFTASNLTSITTRLHNTLQSIQGGVVGEYNHLTNAQLAAVNAITKISGNTGSIATGVVTTIYTMPAGPAVYQVTVNVGATNNSVSYGAYAIVLCDATTARLGPSSNGTANQLSLSGMAIQVSQSSGASAVVNYSITKIG